MKVVDKSIYNIEITLNENEKKIVEKALEITAQKHYRKEMKNNKEGFYTDYLINEMIKYRLKNGIAKNKLYNIYLHTFELNVLLFALYYYETDLVGEDKTTLENVIHIIMCESDHVEEESREFLKLPEEIKLDFYINKVLKNLT